MNLNKKKKGFTIVELVIVIAVIGILSAILIPTFANLINKANVSADQALVRNLNTSLAIEELENGKHPTMHQTLEAMHKVHGYDIATITSKSGSEIVWDSKNNVFVLVRNENGKDIFFTGTKEIDYKTVNYNDLWKIYKDGSKVNEETKFSVYLFDNEYSENITVNVSFDVGNNANINEITYNGSSDNAVLRTNSGNLIISNGSKVSHYGMINDLTINLPSDGEYHEYGAVVDLVSFAGKKFFAESSSKFCQTEEQVREKVGTNEAEVLNGAMFSQKSPFEKIGEISTYGDLIDFIDGVGKFSDISVAKLVADINKGDLNSGSLHISGSKTINLNGHGIEGFGMNDESAGYDEQSVFYIDSDGVLTIEDSVGDGYIKSLSVGFAVYCKGTFNMIGGKLIGSTIDFEVMKVYNNPIGKTGDATINADGYKYYCSALEGALDNYVSGKSGVWTFEKR